MSDAGYSAEVQRKRKLANDCFKRATEAMSKQNWDYAVEMFATSAKLAPDNLMFRQSLTGCLGRKYKQNKSGASMSYLKLSGIRSRIKKARGAKKWDDLDLAALEGHQLNPWDAQFNADLGDAARARDYLEIAAYYYTQAVSADGDPKNIPYLMTLSEILEERGDYNGAIEVLDRVGALDPLNGNIRTKIQGLGANMTINRAKYDEAKSTQDVKQEEPKQGYEESVKGNVKTTKEVLTPGESMEADLLRMTRKEPTNAAHFLKLADYYKREGKLEEAVQTFQKGYEINNDQNIREQMEDVQLDMVRRNLGFAKERATQDKNDEQSRLMVAELAQELMLQEIEVYSRRVDRYPNDLKLKFELAKRFMNTKKYDLAIPLLQAASKDIRLESQVLTTLGKAFLAKKQNVVAKRQFEKAVEKLSANDNPIPFKECHYYLGLLAQSASDNATAEKHYTEILAVDYSYKDVAKRLSEIQGHADEGEHIDLE